MTKHVFGVLLDRARAGSRRRAPVAGAGDAARSSPTHDGRRDVAGVLGRARPRRRARVGAARLRSARRRAHLRQLRDPTLCAAPSARSSSARQCSLEPAPSTARWATVNDVNRATWLSRTASRRAVIDKAASPSLGSAVTLRM